MTYRTDLALERRELIKDTIPQGVSFNEEILDKVKITRISIDTDEGAKAIGKPLGAYITMEIPSPTANPTENGNEIDLIAQELSHLLPTQDPILVVGLGNEDITPDALGPKTIEATLATRHITESEPQFGFRSVATIIPSVLGKTGVETADIIRGVVNKINPTCVMVVDALASKSLHRLCNTVQISNTGISPGSGVQNKRKELSQETLGVPVISIGVPTVVDAMTISNDVWAESGNQPPQLQQSEITPLATMMVTPREIDSMVDRTAKLLGLSINKALHSHFTIEDLFFLSL